MSPSLEFEGKAVETAVKKASKELNIPEDKLEYDVISYGSTGIFGIVGTKKAKIRVKINKHNEKSEKLLQKEKILDDDFYREIFEDSLPETKTKVEPDNREKPDKQTKTEPEKEVSEETGNEIVEYAKEFLGHIITHISEDFDIDIKKEKDRFILNISGGNSAIIIGKKGQTLEAIQYIVEKAIHKKSEKRVKIIIDVEGYLGNRRSSLRNMARKMAEKAKRTKKPITIGQMNSYDRRTVHLALKEDNSVKTQSIGDGFYRKLIIIPRKNSGKKQQK